MLYDPMNMMQGANAADRLRMEQAQQNRYATPAPPAAPLPPLLNPINRGVPQGAAFPDGRPQGQPLTQWPMQILTDFNQASTALAQGNTAPPNYMEELMKLMSPQSQAWASGEQLPFTSFNNMPQVPLPGSPEWMQSRREAMGIL